MRYLAPPLFLLCASASAIASPVRGPLGIDQPLIWNPGEPRIIREFFVEPFDPPAVMKPIPPHERVALSSATADAARGLNRFGFDLFGQLRTTSNDANDLVSPLSIATAFGMTYAGARGETARQMEQVFGFDASVHEGFGGLIEDLNTPREGRDLSVANRLFAAEGLRMKEEFLATNRDAYGAPVERLDFYNTPEPSRQRINDWVEEQTNDRIQDLLPVGSIDRGTALVLTNALYFNGTWKHSFNESATQDKPFHLSDGGVQSVPTMRQRERYRYGEFDGYQMLEMPYAGDDLSMVIALPESADGLAEFEASYTAQRFDEDFDALAYHEVIVSLPKFTYETSFKLKDELKALGLVDAFDDADFSGIADEDLFIDDVYHKTFIDVSEQGTEAAAATAVAIAIDLAAYQPPVDPKQFTADRGFLYAIRDNHSGALMFLGRMGDPGGDAAAAGLLGLTNVPEPTGAWLFFLGCLQASQARRRSQASPQ